MNATITLKDLSTLSGFSVSTVSKALNDKLDISSETRSVIKDIAKTYNYIPNNYAVALRKKQTKIVVVILPQVNTKLYSSFLYNIEKIAYSFGFRIILFQTFEEPSKEKEFIKSSNDGSADGIFILSKNKYDKENCYKKYNNLPIEYIQIKKNQSEERLQKECINSFTTLLKHLV